MILHLDMDAFFASVEQLENPELRSKPVVVGGERRGVVATASYEARAFGIHSAMPVAQARKLCPHAVFLKTNGRRYSEISSLIMRSLYVFSPVVQAASIDEAYLDINGACRIFGGARAVAIAVKECIANVTGGLTCSVGVAPVKFLAKICSDLNKPDGIYILEEPDMDNFLLALPVTKIPGVGRHMAASLSKFGVSSVAHIRNLSRDFLANTYGKWGIRLYERAFGIDPRYVHENLPPKSESAECTFEKDTLDRGILGEALRTHAEKVARRLMRNKLAGRTVTLKIKFADFRQITRSRTYAGRTASSDAIFKAGWRLLEEERLPVPVRLIGLGVSGFEARAGQLYLPGLRQMADWDAPHVGMAASAGIGDRLV